VGTDFNLKEYLRDIEAHFILEALKASKGVRAHAAIMLGMHRPTLVMRIKVLGIDYKPEVIIKPKPIKIKKPKREKKEKPKQIGFLAKEDSRVDEEE
jgi:hypothetical protein